MAVGTTTAVIAGVAVAASLASAGLAYYGQQQQAAAAERMAQYNYEVQRQQNEMQAQMAKMVAEQQHQAGLQNAAVMEREAQRVEMEARERAKRMREENERMLGMQRSRYAAAGVTSEGTPLVVMAETAGRLEQAVGDELYKADMERMAWMRKGEVERWQAGYSLIDKAAAEYDLASSSVRAYPLLMEGKNMAQNLRTSSYGTLLEGVSGAAGSYYNMPRTTAGQMTPQVRRATAVNRAG
jgi:hypothetical protein